MYTVMIREGSRTHREDSSHRTAKAALRRITELGPSAYLRKPARSAFVRHDLNSPNSIDGPNSI